MKKKTLGVVITDRAHLSRLLSLMNELKKSRSFELKVLVGTGPLAYWHRHMVDELKRLDFQPDVITPTTSEGEVKSGNLAMVKTAALGMLEFGIAFNNLGIDIVIVRGDRIEVLPIATAAAYLNKTVVHIEGGDVTGSIDESVRHAVTKLAHLHFVTNRRSRQNVIWMGEPKELVYDVGCLGIDFLSQLRFGKRVADIVVNNQGDGAELNLSDDYVLVMQNPVTTEGGHARRQITETISAIHHLGIQAVWIWPNSDAGSAEIGKSLLEWQHHVDRHRIRIIRYLEPEEFFNMLNHARVLIGNSSTGIKECSWLGVPAVNIGSRQQGRLRANNVIDVPHDRKKIVAAVNRQLGRGRIAKSTLYGNGHTAESMVQIMKTFDSPIQKRLTY